MSIDTGRPGLPKPGAGEQEILPGCQGEQPGQVHQDCRDQCGRPEEPDPDDLLHGSSVQPESVELY